MSSDADDLFRPGDGADPVTGDGPVVAGLVIETRPGQGPFVACRLESVAGLEVIGGDGDRRLAAVWTAASGRSLERAAEELVRDDDEIVGVFPTFVGRVDDDRTTRRARGDALGRVVGEADDGEDATR